MISYNNSAPNAVNNVGQFGATEGSIGAYKSAAEYAADSKYWAMLSQKNHNSISEFLKEVERLYAEGSLLKEDIEQLKYDFENQNQTLLGLIQQTGEAIDNTNIAIGEANAATDQANQAVQDVLTQLDKISNMSVVATTLPPGAPATGSFDNSTGVFSFGIPEGQPGKDGKDGTDGTISDIMDVAVSSPVADDYGFFVDKDNGGLYRTSMSEIAKLVPAVASFNGRTGPVVPAAGDYTVSQVTGAAASGSNSDITSLTGLTTALSLSQGGTGSSSAAGARANLGLGPLSTLSTVPIVNGGTGATTADAARISLVAAKSGANSDITSMANKVTFTQPPVVPDAVDDSDAVTLRQLRNSSDSDGILANKQAVARYFGVKQNEVVYFAVGVDLGGYKVIYDKETQRAYSLPADIAPGTTAISLSTAAILVHSAGSVDLGELAVNREEYVTLSGSFDTGATLNVKNELLTYADGKYRWEGALPKEVTAGTTPETSGGVGLGAWVSVGDAALRDDLAAASGAGLVGGLPVFVTATKYSGGATTSSTSNDAAIIAAINDAIATNSYVYWPAVYEVQGNIPNFHAVKHEGPGGIKRGSDTFRVHPLEWHTNNTYVAKTGSDANDGLSASFPTLTIAKMFEILQGPSIVEMLQYGHWVTNIGAGVYTESAAWTTPVATRGWVEFVGATQISGLPDTVIDGTGSTANGGLYFQQGPSQIKVSNIESRNFTGTSVASGFVFDGRGIDRAWAVNCHGIANLWAGINADSIGQFIVTSGEYRSNTNYQIRIRAGVGFSIGAYSKTNRVNVGNGTGVAIQVRDACTGHIDYTDIHDTATGIQVTNASRVTIVNGTFNTCNIGYSVEAVSTCAHDVTTTFTGVSQMFQTKQNGVAGQDSATNYGGEGMAYNYFNNRYEFGRRLWSEAVAPTSSTAYAFMSSKTGTVDYNFLVPTGSTIRLVGGDVSDRTHSYLALDLPSLRIRGVVKNGVCFNTTSTTFSPGVDNTSSLGVGGARWSQVYAAVGTINTSDAREKTAPIAIDDAVLDAWGDVQLVAFQWLSSVAQKGDSARWHFGVIAQQVRDAFVAHGLDGTRYGLLCYDEWEDEFEPVMAYRTNKETGQEEEYDTGEFKLVKKAGNRWGIRPDQCAWLEAAYQRRRCDRIEARLAKLEAQ